MAHEPIRLSGPQLHRAVLASGGLWTVARLAKVVGRTRGTMWTLSRKDKRWPVPVFRAERYVFYAGEDLLDYLEVAERYEAAQRFSEAIARERVTQKYGSST